MPRPRPPRAEWIAVAIVALALPPALRAAALAATAGTLFEATPFVLAAALAPHGRAPGGALVRGALGFVGCGCDRIGPGALALPAFGIAWLAFGPIVALGRAAAALLVAALVVRRRDRASPNARVWHDAGAGAANDPLAELAGIAPAAFGATLLAEALRVSLAPGIVPPPAAVAIGAALGLLLGMLAPCATGAIAIAAGIREVSPAACVAILATAGIVSLPRARSRPRVSATGAPHAARAAFALLAIACATLAVHGPAGFVNPRFSVPLGAAAIGAAIAAIRSVPRTRVRWPLALPAALLGAYLVGSPLPIRVPVATTLDDPYPGEAIRFVGALARDDGRSATLVRYTITCCRADAEARAVRLDRPLPGPTGAWYEATGTLVTEASGYVLRVATIGRITAPADPFAYR